MLGVFVKDPDSSEFYLRNVFTPVEGGYGGEYTWNVFEINTNISGEGISTFKLQYFEAATRRVWSLDTEEKQTFSNSVQGAGGPGLEAAYSISKILYSL
jgi:hypothetical protein